MASNFQIVFFQTRDSLHMKLDGDFDGNSAYELINALRDHGAEFFQIFIDTNDLKTVHAFGREVFQKNFGALKQLSNLIFIGQNDRHLAQN
jgi:hypothetical protein